MTWIKICGITNREDALQAARLGADAVGFIFAPSPRRIDPMVAREIIARLPGSLVKVGVFVDEEAEKVCQVADQCKLDILQLHGRESPEYCRQFFLPVIKAIFVRDASSWREMERYPFTSILLDAYGADRAGGTGRTFCWDLAAEARKKRNFILSGGLTPGNVHQAIHFLRPQGVDVCSGVERTAGKKDHRKMAEFIREVRKAHVPAG